MSKNSLGNRIRREIVKSPKKAAFLGVLIVVSMYFWVPLFWGHTNNNNEDVVVPVVNQAAVTSSGTINSVKDSKNNRPSWREIRKWIDNDPRMKPAELLAFAQDPFQDMHVTLESSIAEKKDDIKPPPETPASLGMTLSSTIFGQRGGIARISGKTYARGQKIKIEKEGRSYEFILDDIRDRQVILEANGEKYELNIPEPGKSNRMVFGIGR